MEDLEDWPVRALADADLVAYAVVRLRLASWPVDSCPSHAPAMALPPAWGCRVWCPRRGRPWRIGDNKDAATSRLCIGGRKDAAASTGRWRPSLMTPLESCGGSGASQSGSEGIEANHCSIQGPDSGGCGGVARHQTKVVVSGEQNLTVFRITERKAFKRPSIQKLTSPELQAMHQSLLEHRGFLQKELKVQKRTKAALGAKNREWKRLKFRLKSQKRTSTCLSVSEETRPKRLQLCDSFVPLPDLNIPLVGEWD